MEQIYLCPADKRHQCSWEGDMTEIYEHFYTSHEQLLIHSNDFEVKLNTKSENILMLYEEEIYLVQQKVSDRTLIMKLRFLGSHHLAAKINYHIDLETDPANFSENLAFIARDGGWIINIEPIQNQDFQPVSLNCKFVINKFPQEEEPHNATENSEDSEPSVIERENSTKIIKKYSYNEGSRSKLTRSIRHRSVIYGEKLLKELTSLDGSAIHPLNQTLKASENTEVKVPRVKEYTEDDLACATCDKVMLPPIYTCENGHSVCVVCKATSCKLCKSSITGNRNDSLEKISRNYFHACKYACEGCEEKFKYNELLEHEIKCGFCTYACPLANCPIRGTSNIFLDHLRVFHKNIKISETLQNDCPKESEFFVVNKEKGIFYCTCRVKNDAFEWQVIFCGPKERQFFCEIYFKSNRNRDRIYFKRNKERYILRKNIEDLKKMKVKDKHAVLEITSYD